MQNPVNHPESIRDFNRILMRHKWRFIIPFFVVAQIVMLIGMLVPRKYEAQAIFERRNDLVMSEIAGRGAPHSFNMLKKSLVEELSGLPAVENIVKTHGIKAARNNLLNFGGDTSDMGGLIQNIRRRVQVHYDISTPQVDRVRVVYTDSDPKQAQIVVNELIRNYIDTARHQIDDMLALASTFFRKQVKAHEEAIDTLEDEKLRFEIEHAALLPTDATVGSEQGAEDQTQIELLETRLDSNDRRITRLNNELAGLSDSTVSLVKGKNPKLTALEKELSNYEDDLEDATVIQKMTDKHPTVITFRQKIEMIKREIENTPKEVVTEKVYASNQKRTQIELALIHAQQNRDENLAMLQSILKRRTGDDNVPDNIFPIRAKYRKIERAIEDNQRQLKFWEDNLSRVKMSLTAELGDRGINMAFIKPSGVINRPSSPDFMQVIFASLILGSVAGMSFLLYADRKDQSVHSTAQANKLFDIPVLGSVQEITTREELKVRILSRLIGYPLTVIVVIGGLLGAAYLNYVSLHNPEILYNYWGNEPQSVVPENQEIIQPSVRHNPQSVENIELVKGS